MCADAQFDQKFEEYRRYLGEEVRRLAMYIRVYRRLHERREDRLNELNIAPAFFGTVIDALFSVIILWVDKLFDEKGERGFFNFLTFIEYNRESISIAALQRRRGYPDGHRMLERTPITLAVINEDRARIRALEALPSFKLRRDKFHGHFDKDYFFDRKRLRVEAPLKWDDLDHALNLMHEILERYSAPYDGQLHALAPLNIDDIDRLLDELHDAASR
jgi:hypothetical protein